MARFSVSAVVLVGLWFAAPAKAAGCFGDWVVFHAWDDSTRHEMVVRKEDVVALMNNKPTKGVAEILLKRPGNPGMRFFYMDSADYRTVRNCLIEYRAPG